MTNDAKHWDPTLRHIPGHIRHAMLTLPKGWDSYEAEPPDLYAVDRLDMAMRWVGPTWILSRIAPSVVGGAACTFRRGKWKLYMEAENDGGPFAMLWSDNETEPRTKVYSAAEFVQQCKRWYRRRVVCDMQRDGQ